ncbi:MAG: hypothetical protein IIB94_03875 [Candidatus Marinimicrobia bacterium]|nr:hypothetical protein [Candidatus Neomarinimicrobiota bacterium]
MKCKLCLEEKPLLKKSHIIPNFMYKGLFTDDHKLFVVSSDDPSNARYTFTGEYEGNILCKECDNSIIGGYENYAHTVLYGGKNLKEDQYPYVQNMVTRGGINLLYSINIDYAKFKLFLLSFLWKSSISSRPFFNLVNLGKHEEPIRQMLIERNPGESDTYPCMLLTFLNVESVPEDFIGQPQQTLGSSDAPITFLIGGMYYIFYLSNTNRPGFDPYGPVNERGELRIFELQESDAKKFFKSFTGIG